jgi:hypothetical protein
MLRLSEIGPEPFHPRSSISSPSHTSQRRATSGPGDLLSMNKCDFLALAERDVSTYLGNLLETVPLPPGFAPVKFVGTCSESIFHRGRVYTTRHETFEYGQERGSDVWPPWHLTRQSRLRPGDAPVAWAYAINQERKSPDDYKRTSTTRRVSARPEPEPYIRNVVTGLGLGHRFQSTSSLRLLCDG